MYKRNKKYINLIKNFLTDPTSFFLAYNQIKSKPGNTIRAVYLETLDSIDKKWFINTANKIKNDKYIFKTNSTELWSLTIGSLRGKIIQQVIYILIYQIYEIIEKVFLNTSHSSRASRSPYIAIKEIKTNWTGLYWFIETDINKAFDMYNRNIIINFLNKTVSD